MKTIKYFAALAFPVMLASCVNEEIAVETPLKMQEVAGAELIGTDISLNATNGSASSRFVGGESGFGKLDKLGLGWAVVNNGPSQSQTVNGEFYNNKLYANHLFEYVEGETNTFVTKSNIYKGYHFAYYPYTFMEEVGAKTIEISPKQEVGYVDNEESTAYNKRLAQQFQISALQFLDRNSLDDNYQLKREFPMKSPLSQLVVKTTTTEKGSFATNTNLKNYKIKSVTFNLGKDVFAHSAELDVTKLFKLGTNQRPDMTIPQANEQGLLNSFAEVMKPKYATTATVEGETIVTWHNGRASNTKTEVSVDNYVVSASNPRLMTFVLPMNEATSFTEDEKEAVSVEIEAGGGKFVIGYTPNAEEKSPEDTNNKALAQLVAAYSEGGAFVGKYNQQEILNIVLLEKDFVADFTGVTNDNWAEKVQLANDLNRGVETFTLAKGANVIFEGKNLDAEGKMLAPKHGVIVNTVEDNPSNGTLTIEGNTVWNEMIDINKHRVTLEVLKDATLEVNSVLAPSKINNYGTISALAQAEVGKIWNNEGYLFNYGRVDVTYGAFVNVNSTAKGIIAYALNASDVENPSRVMELIATSSNEHGHANVNTLVINKPIDIDLYKNVDGTTGSTEEGRYNDKVTSSSGATGAYWIQDLAEVSLEINEGIVKASYAPVTVANVTMTGGTINNIEIGGKLTIEGGHNKVNVNDPQKIASVEIKGGENTIYATEIKTVVETVKGRNAIHAYKIGSDLTVNGEHHEIVVTELKNVDVTGSAVISNSNIDGNLTVNSGTTKMENVNISRTLTNNGTVVVSGNEAAINHIKNNGTFTTNTDITVKTIAVNSGSSATIATGKTIWFTIPEEENGYIQEGTTTGRIKFLGITYDASSNEELLNAINDGKTEIKLQAGNYEIPSSVAGKEITIIGSGNETVIDFTKNYNTGDATLTFKNLKIQGKNEINMSGFGIQHTDKHISYVNCVFDGAVTNEYYGSVSYTNCKFTGTGYITTYSVKSATFDGCIFDKDDSRAVLVYSHGDNPVNVTLTNCQFYADEKGKTGKGDWTAAVEVDTTNMPTAGTTVTINNCTYDNNYSGIVRDKSTANINAVINVK